MQELITIGIPTYNGAKYLRESLDSVINQTYQHLDILVIDDCSTDETITIIEEYQKSDNRIRLIRNQSNPGMVANWNRCLREARAEWIKLHFQDDLMNPDTIERMLATARKLNVRCVITDREYIFEEGVEDFTQKLRRLSSQFSNDSFIGPDEMLKILFETELNQNFIGEPIIGMIHRSLLNEVGLYDERLRQIVDLEFWLRIGLYEPIGNIADRLHQFRVHKKSQGARNTSKRIVSITAIDKVIIANKIRYASIYNKVNGQAELRRLMRILVTREVVENGYRSLEAIVGSEPLLLYYNSFSNDLKSNWSDMKNWLLHKFN